MKKDIHPDYHPVVFRDSGAGIAFLTRSTATSDKTIVWDDGQTYPVVDAKVSVATASSIRSTPPWAPVEQD